MKKKPTTHNFEPIEKPTWEMTDAELEAHQNEMDAATGWSAGAPLVPAGAEPLDDEQEDGDGDLWEHVSDTDFRSLSEANADSLAAIGDDEEE